MYKNVNISTQRYIQVNNSTMRYKKVNISTKRDKNVNISTQRYKNVNISTKSQIYTNVNFSTREREQSMPFDSSDQEFEKVQTLFKIMKKNKVASNKNIYYNMHAVWRHAFNTKVYRKL